MGIRPMLLRPSVFGNAGFIIEDSLTQSLEDLAVNFPAELRAAMALVSRDFLDICNNWVPKCPVDTGRLLASSAVFVDNELTGGGSLSNLKDVDAFMARHDLRNDRDYGNFMDYQSQFNPIPRKLRGTGLYNIKEITISVVYFAEYAVVQHEGIHPVSGNNFRVYTREGSGPKFVEAKYTLYKNELMELLQSAVNEAFERL